MLFFYKLWDMFIPNFSLFSLTDFMNALLCHRSFIITNYIIQTDFVVFYKDNIEC